MAGQAEKFLKGMNKDTARIDQIDGTYRDALNAIIDSDKGAITSEQGNSFVAALVDPAVPTRPYSVVGQIALPNDDFLMFGVHGNATSGIFYIDTSAQTSRLLLTTSALGFDTEYPITGEFRVSPLGEIIVYFTDNKYTETTEPNTGIKYISDYNPPRVFNVTRQIEYLDNGGSDNHLYSTPTADISILNLFMDSGRIPEFKSLKILQGGGIESGTYYLGVAYADKDFTETNVLTLSNPVYIVPSPESTIPREIISGSPNEYQTNKSIKWILNNVNPDYKYVVPYIIQRIGNAEFAYKLEAVEINTGAVENLLPNEVEIVYSGLENAAQSSVDKTVIDKVRFLTAKSLTQLDNKLYAANLTARKDLGFQRFANSIKLNAKVETIGKDPATGEGAFDPRSYDEFNLNNGYAAIVRQYGEASDKDLQYLSSVINPVQSKGNKGYRDVEELLYKKKTYRRGEVYAFYISFILKDGGESYAYHIPGRNVSATGGPYWDFEGVWEKNLLQTNVPGPFLEVEIRSANPGAKNYQYLDTSIATGLSTSYWENENEFYPNTDDFDTWEVNSFGEPVQTGSMRGTNVRHHKMPSNHNILYSHIVPNVDYSTPNLSTAGYYVKFEESVRILGIELTNIRIPQFILNQIQGYKVYYAKRTQGNKTIIGQSGLHPGSLFLAANLSGRRSLALQGPFYNLYYMIGTHTTDNVFYQYTGWSSTPHQLQSVFKFHDFNLLRKKHTLATATHVDLQYVVTMQLWKGGYKGANTSGSDTGTIDTFRAGRGDDEHAWVHPDLNNTINFEETDPNSANYVIEGPTSAHGTVLIGARYNEIGATGIDVGVKVGGITTNQQVLNYYQSIFTIAPDSATYLAGLSYLKNASATAFKGVTYLVNDSGESAIALGMTSGIPPLAGYGNANWALAPQKDSLTRVSGTGIAYTYVFNYNSYTTETVCLGAGDAAASLFITTGDGNALFDAARNWAIENNINGAAAGGGVADNVAIGILTSGYETGFTNSFCGGTFIYTKDTILPGGSPNTYLANLCSAKTDVFEPFDQQQLISTGYYKSTLGVNIISGLASDGVTNYYSGATSDVIFGGDTYICRYGYRTTSQSFGFTYFKTGPNSQDNPIDNLYGDIPMNMGGNNSGEVYPILWGNLQERIDTINNPDNWIRGNVSPITSLYQYIVESDDNINFRHCGDVGLGVSPAASMYFDKYTASDVLYKSPLYDLTKMDNLLYEDQYSAQQDKRVTVPYPKKERSTNLYPNRIIRSNTQDGNFDDAYRSFLGVQYKDFGQNKGPITNIFNLNALIYIHTEKSLFRTKGKQTMELGDTSQAYIGSGDLFAQEPDEFVQSSEGHLGSYNKLGSLVTKDGYVFVSRKTRKIFLVGQKVIDLSEIGLGTWSRDFIPFAIENYGLNLDAMNINQDAPTGRFGFLVTYDPLFKRTIITKRELVPTYAFQNAFASGKIYYDTVTNSFYSAVGDKPISLIEGIYFEKSGWTISFSNDFTVWASRHSYIPPMYAYNSKYLFSFDPSNPWNLFEHHDYDNPGRFYNSIYNFEFEFIYTGETTTTTTGAVSSTKAVNKIFTSISYVADVFRKEATSLRQFDHKFDTGFTSFFVYNTTQNSSEVALSYLSNIRKTDNTWVTNAFRDLSAISFNTNLVQGQINIHGDLYNGTYTTSNTETMFLSEGVINTNYLDFNKAWYDQRKFVDKFLGIRLISNNQAKNLINLYTAKAAYRTSNR